LANTIGQGDRQPRPSHDQTRKDNTVLEEIVKKLTEASERIDRLGVRL
jgi:hypothetical protein